MSVGERMDAVKKLAESISDEEESKIQVVKFFNALEMEIAKKADMKDKNIVWVLESLEKVRQYSNEQSPSLKMLMEYVAMTIPNF